MTFIKCQWDASVKCFNAFFMPDLFFCVRLDGVFFMMLRFGVGERREGLAPLVSDLLVVHEANRGLIPGWSS